MVVVKMVVVDVKFEIIEENGFWIGVWIGFGIGGMEIYEE